MVNDWMCLAQNWNTKLLQYHFTHELTLVSTIEKYEAYTAFEMVRTLHEF